MPIGTAAAIALGLGALTGGVGSALAAKGSGDAQKEAQRIANMGPVRGGSDRAGGQKIDIMADPEKLAKLGEIMAPLRSPVYGDMPLDLKALYNPQKFGTGFNVGNKPKNYFG